MMGDRAGVIFASGTNERSKRRRLAPLSCEAGLQFHSKFAHKANAVEIVTMMLQDGTWKVTERRRCVVFNCVE
jgi:hypothetical protein